MPETFAKRRRPSRIALITAISLAVPSLVACTDWLTVTNPGAIEPPQLDDTAYIGLMVNGVVGDFQPAFAWTALFSGAFSDELRIHQTFFENVEIDRRDVNENNGTYLLAVYNGLHRVRFLADSVAVRITSLRGAAAASDLRLARVLAYGGYSYVFLGEQMCETPLNRSAPVPSDALLDSAIARFDQAIAVAAAGKAAAILRADSLAADTLANFARVGAARAALNLGDDALAIQYASAVTPAYVSPASMGFAFRAYYVDAAPALRRRTGNPFWEFANAERWVSVSGTPFDGLHLRDPRVPAELRATADATTRLTPNSSQAFSTYNPTLRNATDNSFIGARFAATSSIRVASALEARYIVAEAEGPTPANLAFVNERRAIGADTALTGAITPAEYLTALRDQRRRDFFIDGHRLGDLRRYKRFYGVDEFPSGPYFGSTTVSYGTQECWPIPVTER